MKIHGLACFETSNGLQAWGTGRLLFADRYTEIFEFGNPKFGGSEYLSTSVPTFFVRKFYFRGILAHLVGVVKKTRDNFGRAGFWGLAAMVDDDKPMQVEILEQLFELSDRTYTSSIQSRNDMYKSVLENDIEMPPGDLSNYEDSETMIFSVPNGILSNEILRWCKSLMMIEPSRYSTLIVQLGKVENINLGKLDAKKFSEVSESLTQEAKEIQADLDLENMEPHVRRFIERTDKIGVERPESVDAEFENYLIGLIRYVNSSVAQRKKR